MVVQCGHHVSRQNGVGFSTVRDARADKLLYLFHAVFNTAVPRIKQSGITTNEDHHRYAFGG